MERKKKHIFTILIFCLLAIIVSGVCVRKENVQAQEQKTIRVGYIDYKGFVEKDEEGQYYGYCVDYLNEIAKYTGWKFEFVYGTWNHHLKALQKGELDLVCQAQTTKERKKKFIFSKYSVGTESGYLYVKDKDERYYYNDFERFNGMRVAVLDKSFQNQALKEYAKNNGFTYIEKKYSTISKAYQELEDGKVDAVAVGSLSVNTKYRTVCQFGADPFYMMSGKKNTSLMNEINNTLGRIKSLNQTFETELYNEYYGSEKAKAPIAYTKEEARWIAKHKTVTVGLLPGVAPFSYVDENGKMAGITKDIVEAIGKKSGIHFKFEMLKAQQTSINYMKKHPNAFVAGINELNPLFDTEKTVITDVYYKDDVVLVSQMGKKYDLFAAKDSYVLAVPASYIALSAYVEENYPQFKIKIYKSNEACFEGVKTGQADFLAQNINVIKPYLQKPRYSSLTILPSYFMVEKMGMVATKSEETLIIKSIINKAIAGITEDEKEQYVLNRTTENSYSLTTNDFIYKFRYALIIITSLLGILVIGVIIFVRSRKRNYDHLALINRSLENAVAKADSANAAKSRFLAQMSHEIRTPMNAIIGLTDIAKAESEKDSKMQGYLDKIAGSSKLLLGIINDVLDMSAIEGGKLKIDSAEYNFKKQISDITTVFYQQAHQKNISFEVKMKGVTEETVIGDQLRVDQILMNLLSNAIKFTPSGGKICLLVIQASRARDHVQFRFIVTDTGCGMSKEMMGRLFQPFEQESASVARKYGGSGLGLSIAKSLVEMMGGTIRVESELEKGTTFTVDIPFVLSKKKHIISKREFHDIRTLVVDDDKEASEYAGTILKRMGVQYDIALSGEEALIMLGESEDQKKPYKMCLIDWKMPDMDGIALTKEIRSVFGEEAIVITLLAYDISEAEKEGSKAGVDYYIAKPLFSSTLFNIIMQVSTGSYSKIVETEEKKYDFSGRRVLIAEDVALNMEVAIKLLGMVGVNCTCAEDGKQAVEIYEKAEEGYYDAIFLDINMPVMDGYEAAKHIRNSHKKDALTVPIYAMTANAFAEDVTRALNAGMNGHFAKPIETKVLYSGLEQIWGKTKE